MTTVERWRMPSGRIGTIDLGQDRAAVELLRDALRDSGAELLADDGEHETKNAPDGAAATAVEGEETETPTGDLMFDTSVPTNPEAIKPLYSPALVAAAMRDVAECPDGHIFILDQDEELFQLVPASVTKPIEWARTLKLGQNVHLVLLLDANGYKVDCPANWDDLLAELPRTLVWTWRQRVNSVITVAGNLAISLGEYLQGDVLIVDGQEVMELLTQDEWGRRSEQDRDRYLADHPEILAAKPAWADDVNIELGGGECGVEYSRSVGRVHLYLGGMHEDGKVLMNETAPSIQVDYERLLNAGEMRELAAALMTAADAFGAAAAGA